jgi:transcription initiation factor TFIIIB Brf1 subunit/transcription initiation factor TFIIB
VLIPRQRHPWRSVSTVRILKISPFHCDVQALGHGKSSVGVAACCAISCVRCRTHKVINVMAKMVQCGGRPLGGCVRELARVSGVATKLSYAIDG